MNAGAVGIKVHIQRNLVDQIRRWFIVLKIDRARRIGFHSVFSIIVLLCLPHDRKSMGVSTQGWFSSVTSILSSMACGYCTGSRWWLGLPLDLVAANVRA